MNMWVAGKELDAGFYYLRHSAYGGLPHPTELERGEMQTRMCIYLLSLTAALRSTLYQCRDEGK